MTLDEIRKDLREIRYYYSMEKLFQPSDTALAPIAIKNKVGKYNLAIKDAPAKLYVLYMSLYVNNCTQAMLAEEWGYCNDYIKQLNKMLCEFFLEKFNKDEI